MVRTIEQKRMKGRLIKTSLFFAPAIVLLGLFFVGPMVLAVFFSLTNFSLTGSSAMSLNIVGLRNFREIFQDPKMKVVMGNTLWFLLFSGIIGQEVLGFLLASLMRGKSTYLRRFVGFTVVVGWVTPEIVAAFMFGAFFADGGTLNKILVMLGAPAVSWLFKYPMLCIVIANIWKGSAYSMMMFQASLDTISNDIIEAAEIDGANAFHLLFRITLPMIRDTLGTVFIIVTLGTLGTFGMIYAMTGGGPSIKTTTLAIFMYQKAFVAYQVGYGMAIAMLILAVGVALSLLYIRLIDTRK